MTGKAKENLVRLLKANNPASRNLEKILLENSDLSAEEQKQVLVETGTVIVRISYSPRMTTSSYGESWAKEIWLNGDIYKKEYFGGCDPYKEESMGFFIPAWPDPTL